MTPELPIRCCRVTPGVCRNLLCNDILVEAATEQIIEAKLENGFEHNTGTSGILGEKRELRGKSEINLARTLVIPRDGLTLVRVANFSNRPMRQMFLLPISSCQYWGGRFFHLNQSQIRPVSLTQLVQLKKKTSGQRGEAKGG